MSDRRWRGTLIYAGAVAAMGAAGLVKFTALTPPPAASAVSGDRVGDAPVGPADGAPGGPTTGGSTADAARSGPSATRPATGGTTSAPGASDPVTVVGSSVRTRYGPVQVSVTFADGRITGVEPLAIPDAHRESVQINARAVPVLIQEVLDAQSARIDTVSGATYTSEAYRQSVQFAIDQQG